ncbi:serine hydrolase [Erythrobacter arachoides]|uniref:Serine hydrolase n=1 Tax=Aurantiacibacter arachoides TaxID=1850444 RepID=A0A844ZZV2_9SPHN|nr:serine hydrolase domain-containing protein [Aurantiacibacter arachoides]MXO93723.1 serine hydrolase [Aurantiacibacter arachoides]GGD47137.1 serine hydrolase [Aurantiacibacter arachoides]
MSDLSFHAALSRRDALRGGAVLGAGALVAASPFAALAQSEAANWPAVQRFVRSFVDQRKVAGMVAALGWGQAAPDFIAGGARTFGGADAVGADTLWRIYSMTKPITGMATMMCIDDGLLALDQPLYEILPAYRTMRVQKSYDGPITADNLEPAARPITIRHLLTHTSGLGYPIVQQGAIRQAFGQRGLVPLAVSRMALAREFFGGEARGTLESFADGLAEMPLVYQPGTRWSYSMGLDLLGRVIEMVSGQAFDAFLQTRLFDPLGMRSTTFQVPREDAGRLAANYFVMADLPLPVDLPNSSVFLDRPAFPFGGAGLVSSARDYDRFLQMLAGFGEIDGRRVMSEAAVRLGTSNLMPDTLASNGGFASGGRSFGFGAGGLSGTGEAQGLYGWFGAAGTAGLVNLDQGLRQTLMTQYMPADSYDAQQRFPLIVAEDAAARRGA